MSTQDDKNTLSPSDIDTIKKIVHEEAEATRKKVEQENSVIFKARGILKLPIMIPLAIGGVITTWAIDTYALPYMDSYAQFTDTLADNTIDGPRTIYSGSGRSSYTVLSNHFSDALDNRGYYGYGFSVPSGSVQTANAVLEDPNSLGLMQEDVYLRLRNENPNYEALLELQNTGMQECMLPLSKDTSSWEEIIERAQNGEMPRIAVPGPHSGSHNSAIAILTALGIEEMVEIRTYNANDEMVEALENGSADVIMSMERPGTTYLRWLGQYDTLMSSDSFNAVSIAPETYTHIQNDPEMDGLSLNHVHLTPRFFNWNGQDHEANLLCTDTILVGQDPNSSNENNANIERLHRFHSTVRQIEQPNIPQNQVTIMPLSPN